MGAVHLRDRGRPDRLVDIPMIPLREAVLCAECDVVSNSKTDTCPACASRSLYPLIRFLDRVPSVEVQRLEAMMERQ